LCGLRICKAQKPSLPFRGDISSAKDNCLSIGTCAEHRCHSLRFSFTRIASRLLVRWSRSTHFDAIPAMPTNSTSASSRWSSSRFSEYGKVRNTSAMALPGAGAWTTCSRSRRFASSRQNSWGMSAERWWSIRTCSRPATYGNCCHATCREPQSSADRAGVQSGAAAFTAASCSSTARG
jgi:hypothetical protein